MKPTCRRIDDSFTLAEVAAIAHQTYRWTPDVARLLRPCYGRLRVEYPWNVLAARQRPWLALHSYHMLAACCVKGYTNPASSTSSWRTAERTVSVIEHNLVQQKDVMWARNVCTGSQWIIWCADRFGASCGQKYIDVFCRANVVVLQSVPGKSPTPIMQTSFCVVL